MERTNTGPGITGIPVKGSQKSQDNNVMNRFAHFQQEMTKEKIYPGTAAGTWDIVNSHQHSLPFISFYIKTEPLVNRLSLPSHTVLQG